MKDWIKNDLIETLDIEGLLDMDTSAIQDAESVRTELSEKVAVLNNDIIYTRFVINHHDDIASNEQSISTINYHATNILVNYKKDIESHISSELKALVEKYILFFNELPDSINALSLHCSGLNVPSSPFAEIIEFLNNEKASCLSFSEASEYDSLIISAKDIEKLAKDIENIASSMIKYNISEEFSSFDNSRLSVMEFLLGGTISDTSTEDLQELKIALLDLMDQLNCINEILDSQD